MNSFDIIISGAGPAGTTCAMHLAKSGLKIALIDKSQFPRPKICGGGLSDRAINALKRIPGNVWTNFLKQCNHLQIDNITITSPAQISVKFNIPNDYGYTINREEFDNFMLQQTISNSNISFFPDTKAISYSYKEDYVEIKTNIQTYRASLLIIADGINSLLARQTKLIDYKVHNAVVCVQSVCNNYNTEKLQNGIEFYFSKNTIPSYFWLFPLKDGTCNIGLAQKSSRLRKSKKHILEVYNEVLNDKHIQSLLSGAVKIDKPKIALLPTQNMCKKLSRDRIIICGTAGMLVDPLNGEGIGNGMVSGEMAALQALECFRNQQFDAKFMHQYDKALYKRIGKGFAINKQILKILDYECIINMIINRLSTNMHLKNKVENIFLKND